MGKITVTEENKGRIDLTRIFGRSSAPISLEARDIERVVKRSPEGALLVMKDGNNIVVEESFRQVKASVTAALQS